MVTGQIWRARKVKAHPGKVHNYLGMIFEYEDEGKVKVDMSSYVKNMLDDFQ